MAVGSFVTGFFVTGFFVTGLFVTGLFVTRFFRHRIFRHPDFSSLALSSSYWPHPLPSPVPSAIDPTPAAHQTVSITTTQAIPPHSGGHNFAPTTSPQVTILCSTQWGS